MSKREGLPLTFPTEEYEASKQEDDIYGLSDLRISPEGLSPHRSPNRNSPSYTGFSESSFPSTSRDIFHSDSLRRPNTLRLPSPGASPSSRSRSYEWSPRLTGYSDVSPPTRSRSVSSRRKLTGSSEISPPSPSRSLSSQWNFRLTDTSRASPPSTSSGVFRSYTIQKPWNPRGPGAFDVPVERPDQVVETYSASFRQADSFKLSPPSTSRSVFQSYAIQKSWSPKKPASSGSSQWSPKRIDSSGRILANSPSPSGGTFRSYSIQRSWSPKGPDSPEHKAPEYTVKDERVYQVYSSNYTQTESQGPESPQATKYPWNIRRTGSSDSPPSPSSGILRKSWNPKVSDSSEASTSSPEKQRMHSGRTFSPCIFSPRASPETSRPSTPLHVREITSNQGSPRQLRVKFSAEPEEIDFGLPGEKTFNPEDLN